jgi:hypothetical protein
VGQINWAEYAEKSEKEGGFTPLPVGVYNIKVDTADVKPAKNEHFGILTRLVVTDGPLVSRSILNNMTLYKNDGDINGYFNVSLAALGFGTETNPAFWTQLQQLPDEQQAMQFIASSILNAEATIEVTNRVHAGINRDNVKKMVPKGAIAAAGGLPPGMPLPGGAAPGVVPVAAPPGTVPVLPGAVPLGGAAPVPLGGQPIVPAVVPVAPGVPGVAAPVTVNVAAPAAAAPAAVAPVVAEPVAPVAAPVAAAPVAVAPMPTPATPAPVAAPIVAEAPVAVAPVEAVPVVVPVVAAPIPTVAAVPLVRPDEAPF